jgi:hypothetical protein
LHLELIGKVVTREATSYELQASSNPEPPIIEQLKKNTMKKIFAILILICEMTASAQDHSNAEGAPKVAITDKGKPDGEKSEMKIGKEGGSFTSSDGKIRLIFPEGALSKKTNISIQPVTNHAPNGNGKVYQMEPSGVDFKKPVQIIFYYDKNDIGENPADLMGIAMQDEKGLWSSLNKFSLYTVANTLSGEIRHFSAYVNYSKAKILPASAKLKVNGSLRLQINLISDTDEDEYELTPLSSSIITIKNVWSVNSIKNGNSTVGIVSASQNYSAIYQAPAQVPKQNPVAVSVEPDLKSPRKLVSNILIYDDAYEVNMVAAMIGGSRDAWGGVVTYTDAGSFVVSLKEDPPAIISIKNQLELVTDNCQKIITNPTTCTGLLHVAGSRSIKVTPANPPGQPHPIVEIWFVPHPTELSRFKFLCPPPPSAKGSSKGEITMASLGMLSMFGSPALPHYIKFVAKDEEQVILEKKSPGKEIYYKFSVKKIQQD